MDQHNGFEKKLNNVYYLNKININNISEKYDIFSNYKVNIVKTIEFIMDKLNII